MKRALLSFVILLYAAGVLSAQEGRVVSGKVYGAVSKEAIASATIADDAGHMTSSDAGGNFTIGTTAAVLEIRIVGYQTVKPAVSGGVLAIALHVSPNQLNQVVVSSSSTAEKRSEAPVAISTILPNNTYQSQKIFLSGSAVRRQSIRLWIM